MDSASPPPPADAGPRSEPAAPREPKPSSFPRALGFRREEPASARNPLESIAPFAALARAQEITRTRVFFSLALALEALLLLVMPILGGDPAAKQVLFLSQLPGCVGAAWFVWALGRERRYSRDRALFVGLLCLVSSLGGLYFFGVLSLAVVVLPLGILFFASVADERGATLAYLAAASSYFVLVAATLRGAIQYVGLMPADLTPPQRLILAALVEVVLLFSFLHARAWRAMNLVEASRHERLLRGLAQKDALLQEARHDLARALDVVGVGRFSDTTVGSFQLGNVIGRGAMGEIYEAFHAHTRKEAAVKLLHAHSMRDRTMLRRFVREAKIAASLDTPYVVRVLEVGGFEREGELPFIAMERLRGEDLSELMRRLGRLPLADVVAMATQVGRGLMAARAGGIVHRDLKPRNVYLAECSPGSTPTTGTAATPAARIWKILDFGVSKLAGHEGTQTLDRIVGTPEYMAPEQAAGAEVTHRTDVFSLAVIAYRALTGRPAFTGEHIVEILYRVANTSPPRASEVASIPSEIDDVLAIAMAKAPADRFDTAEEFASALEAASRGELSPPLSARAATLLERMPWNSDSNAPSARS